MARLSKNFISFVAIGGQNPRILNIDFLINNRILSVDQESAKSKDIVKKFVSVPGLANLALDKIEFIVDEMRLQIRENNLSAWTDTKIFEIAKRYFEVLPHTPLKIVGVNLNSTIIFNSPEEAQKCQELCLPRDSQLAQIISSDSIIASLILRYPYSDSDNSSRIMLTIEQPNKENNRRAVNFNYEFEFTNWEKFNDELEKIPEVAAYTDTILQKLLGVI